MPDAIAPVGAMVNAPNPQQGMQALSGILGIKQAQQNLQTGAYTQATAQAQSQQEQQKNQELQAAQQLALQGAKSGKYTNPDGTLNRQKMADDITTVAPTYGQERSTQLLSQANEVVQNQQAHQALSADQQKQMGNAFLGLAGKGGLSNSDVIDAVGNLRSNNTDPKFNRMLDSMLTHLPQAANSQQLQKLMATWGAASTGQSQVEPGTVSTGAQILPTTGNKFTGTTEIGGSAGPGVKAQLSPAQQPAYIAQASAAGAGAGARATGAAGSDIDRANQISGNVKSSTAGIQTTQQIDDLSDQIHSGKYASWLSKQAAAAGIKEDTYARQLLEKDLGIVRTQLTAAAPSDARAATILSGTPDATSDPQTIHGAMDYVRGSMRQNVAQGQNLNAYRSKHPDLSGFQGADDAFTSGAGPLMHEFLSLKDEGQKAAFYKRNFKNPQEALQFRNQAYAASHSLGLDHGNR